METKRGHLLVVYNHWAGLEVKHYGRHSALSNDIGIRDKEYIYMHKKMLGLIQEDAFISVAFWASS